MTMNLMNLFFNQYQKKNNFFNNVKFNPKSYIDNTKFDFINTIQEDDLELSLIDNKLDNNNYLTKNKIKFILGTKEGDIVLVNEAFIVMKKFIAHTSRITSIIKQSIKRDSITILTSSDDGLIKSWKIGVNVSLIYSISIHESTVNKLMYYLDDSFYSCSNDFSVKFVNSKIVTRKIELNESIVSLCLIKDLDYENKGLILCGGKQGTIYAVDCFLNLIR